MPLPATWTWSWNVPGGTAWKVAVTSRSTLIVRTQRSLPVQPSLHPTNANPGSAIGVSVIVEPCGSDTMHADPQSTAGGLLVTRPPCVRRTSSVTVGSPLCVTVKVGPPGTEIVAVRCEVVGLAGMV